MHGPAVYVCVCGGGGGEGGALYCISRKLYGFLLMISAGFTSLSVLLLFPLLITFFYAQFLILIHLT